MTDKRVIVVVLIEGETPHTGAVGVHYVKVGDKLLLGSVPTGDTLKGCVGVENDPPVRKVAGLEAVDIVRRLRDLPQTGTVNVYFKDLPVRFARLRKEQLIGVPVKVDMADKAIALRFIECRVFSGGGIDDPDLVLIISARQRRLAFVISGKAQVFKHSLGLGFLICLRPYTLNAKDLQVAGNRIAAGRSAAKHCQQQNMDKGPYIPIHCKITPETRNNANRAFLLIAILRFFSFIYNYPPTRSGAR